MKVRKENVEKNEQREISLVKVPEKGYRLFHPPWLRVDFFWSVTRNRFWDLV